MIGRKFSSDGVSLQVYVLLVLSSSGFGWGRRGPRGGLGVSPMATDGVEKGPQRPVVLRARVGSCEKDIPEVQDSGKIKSPYTGI